MKLSATGLVPLATSLLLLSSKDSGLSNAISGQSFVHITPPVSWVRWHSLRAISRNSDCALIGDRIIAGGMS